MRCDAMRCDAMRCDASLCDGLEEVKWGSDGIRWGRIGMDRSPSIGIGTDAHLKQLVEGKIFDGSANIVVVQTFFKILREG